MPKITDETIKAIASSFLKQAKKYGFALNDYLKFTNILLDEALKSSPDEKRAVDKKIIYNISADLNFPLKTERLIIREMMKKDIPIVKHWLEDEEGKGFLQSRSSGRTDSIEELFEDEYNIFGIITLLDKTPIGLIAYLNVDEMQKKAEMRKMIGALDQRGKRFGNEASKIWIEYGLYSLGLEKIYVTTFNTNIKNIRINEMLGFRVEGLMQNEIKIDGEYHDLLKMNLLKEWFEEKRKELK
ncbi:MAG: GNAT family N-acetyltransferase [Bacteroidetes bacterium]|nr:GNAT family N-acetyltransferase [Bacteroidota bacterium]MBU2584248.1 GNAT family N-acetyltransferase [Bacteroidota bacterium]